MNDTKLTLATFNAKQRAFYDGSEKAATAAADAAMMLRAIGCNTPELATAAMSSPKGESASEVLYTDGNGKTVTRQAFYDAAQGVAKKRLPEDAQRLIDLPKEVWEAQGKPEVNGRDRRYWTQQVGSYLGKFRNAVAKNLKAQSESGGAKQTRTVADTCLDRLAAIAKSVKSDSQKDEPVLADHDKIVAAIAKLEKMF